MNLTDVLIDVLLVFFVVVCVLMGFAIMMQRSKQEGLGTAFGGGVTSELFGAGASSVLVKATVVLAALFFILSISLARLYAHKEAMSDKPSGLQQQLLAPAVAPASTNAAPAAIVPSATPAAAPVEPPKPATK